MKTTFVVIACIDHGGLSLKVYSAYTCIFIMSIGFTSLSVPFLCFRFSVRCFLLSIFPEKTTYYIHCILNFFRNLSFSQIWLFELSTQLCPPQFYRHYFEIMLVIPKSSSTKCQFHYRYFQNILTSNYEEYRHERVKSARFINLAPLTVKVQYSLFFSLFCQDHTLITWRTYDAEYFGEHPSVSLISKLFHIQCTCFKMVCC